MVTRRSSEEMELVPAARSVPVVAGDTPAMREWAERLVGACPRGGRGAHGRRRPVDRDGPSGVADRSRGRAHCRATCRDLTTAMTWLDSPHALDSI